MILRNRQVRIELHLVKVLWAGAWHNARPMPVKSSVSSATRAEKLLLKYKREKGRISVNLGHRSYCSKRGFGFGVYTMSGLIRVLMVEGLGLDSFRDVFL